MEFYFNVRVYEVQGDREKIYFLSWSTCVKQFDKIW